MSFWRKGWVGGGGGKGGWCITIDRQGLYIRMMTGGGNVAFLLHTLWEFLKNVVCVYAESSYRWASLSFFFFFLLEGREAGGFFRGWMDGWMDG